MKWNEETHQYDYLEPGTKVIDEDTGEKLTVKEFVEDVCGDGCCSCYLVEENGYAYWPNKLKEIK